MYQNETHKSPSKAAWIWSHFIQVCSARSQQTQHKGIVFVTCLRSFIQIDSAKS